MLCVIVLCCIVAISAHAPIEYDDCRKNATICGPPWQGLCVPMPFPSLLLSAFFRLTTTRFVATSNATAYDCVCARGYWHRTPTGGCVLKPSATSAISSFAMLCFMLMFGKVLRYWIKPLQLLYLPSSVIGGTLALIIVQICRLDEQWFNYVDREWIAGWEKHPGFLINVVFSALFLGVQIPSVKSVWKNSANQLCYGMFVAWSQWATSLAFTGLFLMPVFHVNELFAASIPIGFSGGHGTAAGLKTAFQDNGWHDGSDVSLGTATVGLLSSVIVGMVLVNIAARRQWVKHAKMQGGTSILSLRGVHELHERPSAGRQTVSSDSIDVLALHLAVIGIAMLFGYATRAGLIALENAVPAMAVYGVFSGFPLFPFCMIGGAIIQKVLQRFNRKTQLIDCDIMDRISGTALDFLIVAAMGTVELTAIGNDIVPFVLLVLFALTWQFICLFVFARIMFKSYFFENGICVFGQSTGVIASGLILLRMVDPESRTGVSAAFGYKQLLHSPWMGGGIWTALSLPLFRVISWYGMLVLTGTLSIAFFVAGFVIRKRTIASDTTLHDDAAGDGESLLGASVQMNDAVGTPDVSEFF